MRMVFGLVLLVGIALAGGAVYMAKGYIEQYQNALAYERAERAKIVPTIPVFVTTRTLKYGEELKEEDVRLVDWPENAIPEGAFTGENPLFATEGEERRLILRHTEKDEAVLASKVTEPGEDAGLTSRLERGMRAFAISVDVSSGVSGFLRPGDKVDVYWTGQIDQGRLSGQGDVTRLIEAAVQIVAVDQTAGGDLEGAIIARTVTVAVRPQQVAALAQAQSTGRLSLSLVGAGDDTVAESIEVTQRSLLGIQLEEVIPEEAPEEICTTRVRRGAEVVELPIPCTN
ncbi:MAG: Flp pilus assembly protein CpaB [Pseudomonadota bacterium]